MQYMPSHTIIPEEYHIVKHPGVLGMKIHDTYILFNIMLFDAAIEDLSLWPGLDRVSFRPPDLIPSLMCSITFVID